MGMIISSPKTATSPRRLSTANLEPRWLLTVRTEAIAMLRNSRLSTGKVQALPIVENFLNGITEGTFSVTSCDTFWVRVAARQLNSLGFFRNICPTA
jgi:hypothetical protein